MTTQGLFGSLVEMDEASTQRWYTSAEEWGCVCRDCSNFLTLAQKRQFPAFVLEHLDNLGIPPEKATYVCHLYDDEKSHLYQFNYRIAGKMKSATHFEIHCWNDEEQWYLLALNYGTELYDGYEWREVI